MEYKKFKNQILLRLDEGEELIQSLKNLCSKEKINSAFISGIGAARKIEIAHFDTIDKKYYSKKFEEMLEIVSINGNISTLNDQHFIHLHGVFGKKDYSTISGHLIYAEISPTIEIVILFSEGKMERKFNQNTSLNLLSF